ncbi:MAG: MFS transporter [Sphingomonas sanxanigenens]|uniref:MFS transporter n=1 Tax=Sphingomonas sanxanigenens TaxID=397260 RepID=A0A2W5A405_9SPHN|nr:MAG: MFS transporter [Sphingomonas sanxanigenens]
MSEPDPHAPARRPSALAPFRHPIFRAVWIASLVSNFGGLIQSVGASWMMTGIAPSPMYVALVQASTTLPIMLLSLVAGAIADNMDRRLVMLWAQGFMLVVSAMLSAFALLGWITPWLLLTFTFLIGVGTAFNGPAWQASVGDMVPRQDLPGAVALNSMGFNIARSTGPAIGGLIVAAGGAAAAFGFNALSYVGLVVVLAMWRPAREARLLPPEGLATAMGAGIRYVAMSPDIGRVLARALVFGVAASAVPALNPLVAKVVLGGGPLTYGVLLGAFGLGAVGGALLSGRLRDRLSSEALVRLCALSFGLASVAVAFSPWLLLSMAMLAICGAGWVIALSTFNVTVQLFSPRWVVARSLALYQTAAFGGMAIGSWIWGLIAEDWEIAGALVGAALVMALCALMGLKLRLPELREIDLAPLRAFKPPEVAVPVEPRSGPVVVTIEYRIRNEDVLEFLNAMAERRRIRRRDGARHWTLMRDLQDPELWLERYHTPTWIDYLRHNQRITKADADIAARVRALHSGEGPPKVHRLIERQTGSLRAYFERGARELADPMTDPTRSS